jgi:hypothetical protein
MPGANKTRQEKTASRVADRVQFLIQSDVAGHCRATGSAVKLAAEPAGPDLGRRLPPLLHAIVVPQQCSYS